jgi:riboflavin kinase/FMN adenylyltransferase
MEIFNELNENKNLSLTLGTFDGIHLGHVAVIKSTTDYAKANNLKSALITFIESPRSLLNGFSGECIVSRDEKLRLISELGIDFVYEIDFTPKFASISAKKYLKDIIVKYFSPKSISTGYNHRFGCGKSGDTNLLEKMQSVYNYEYFEIPPQIIGGEIVSSKLIKEKLSAGLIENANKLVGRRFLLKGIVIRGNKLGREIGFRTANFKYPDKIIKIPQGVYQTETKIYSSEKSYKSVVNFGIRPSVGQKNKEPIVEVHILDGFCADIYGEELAVRFVKKIRDELFFDSLDKLKEQINRDIRASLCS